MMDCYSLICRLLISCVVFPDDEISVAWVNEIEGPHPLAFAVDQGLHWANPSCNALCEEKEYDGPVPISGES